MKGKKLATYDQMIESYVYLNDGNFRISLTGSEANTNLGSEVSISLKFAIKPSSWI